MGFERVVRSRDFYSLEPGPAYPSLRAAASYLTNHHMDVYHWRQSNVDPKTHVLALSQKGGITYTYATHTGP